MRRAQKDKAGHALSTSKIRDAHTPYDELWIPSSSPKGPRTTGSSRHRVHGRVTRVRQDRLAVPRCG